MGIAGFTVLPALGAVLAIIFGGIAKGSIKRGRGSVKGSGMATAGLVLGITGLIIPLVLAAIIVPLGAVFLLPSFTAIDHLQHGVDAVTPRTVRLYCYSTRADRFVAAASGDTWRYNYGRHWGPFYMDSDEQWKW
jgi:hypothetical protein